MAYMGRGGFPSFGSGGLGRGLEPVDNEDNINNDNRYDGRIYCTRGFFRIHYYVPLGNTYVIFQMLATIILFTIICITFLVAYKPSIIDPLENTKKVIMNTYIMLTLTLVTTTLLANIFSKKKNTLLKMLITILITSIITIFSILRSKGKFKFNLYRRQI